MAFRWYDTRDYMAALSSVMAEQGSSVEELMLERRTPR